MVSEQELHRLMVALRAVSNDFKAERQKIAIKGAKYMSAQIKPSAPVSAKPHKRYSTAKANRRIRAPKGRGNVVATYMPGNLKRSVRMMTFRRAKTKAYVGAKVARTGGVFAGARADGYYLHMVEHGTRHSRATPFFVQSSETAKAGTYAIMIADYRRLIMYHNSRI